MNYKKLYFKIVANAKSQTRKSTKTEYYEKHHIIPDFMFKERKRKGPPGHIAGNPNDKSNIVLLTPREHFLVHVLLTKILRGTKYEHAAGSALQFFFTKVINKHPRTHQQIKESKWYSHCRIVGLKSISAARKGTMPVKDSETGKVIGSVSVNHENVLSGKWIHTTKGRKMDDAEKAVKQKQVTGLTNPNASKISDAELYEFAKQFYIPRGYMDKKEFESLCLQHGYPTMRRAKSKSPCFRFAEYGHGYPGLIKKLEEEFGIIYQLKTHYKEYTKAKETYVKNQKNQAI